MWQEQGGPHPQPTAHRNPHGFLLSALDPLLLLGQKLGKRKRVATIRDASAFEKGFRATPTLPHTGGRTQLSLTTFSLLRVCLCLALKPSFPVCTSKPGKCLPPSAGALDFLLPGPPVGEWRPHIEPRSLCADGQRPFPDAPETFIVQDTRDVLESQGTAPKPWGRGGEECLRQGSPWASHFLEKYSYFCFLFVH